MMIIQYITKMKNNNHHLNAGKYASVAVEEAEKAAASS
jgi:hypothetical protein